jgi:uncharacterized repeat protein (TIGR01451 family)
MKPRLLALICLCISLDIVAQCNEPGVFCQHDTVIYSCTGTLMDAGGDGVYPDVSSQFTICPDAPNLRSQIHFTEFDLEPGGNGLQGHQLFIYDGPDISSPLLGVFEGTELSGITISATNINVSGCLLLFFDVYNTANQGHTGWSAELSCVEPCIPPTISFTTNAAAQDQGILFFCNGDAVEFDASGSTAVPGQSIASYAFDFNDDTPIETGATVIHSFQYPQIFEVMLTVTDDFGCVADSVIPIGMLAPTQIELPDINAICLGGDSLLVAQYFPQSISNIPLNINGDTLFLVDGAGFSFNSSIIIYEFDQGELITSCDQFNSIAVNMEHSYMGDLNIALQCPNGTLVNLVTHGINGGGGTYLGIPFDFETSETGIGWNYSWSPESVNGTWGEEVLAGNTTPADPEWPSFSLIPGDYSSQDDLCNFIGCPFNGEWTLIITDNFAADNGYLFNWSIDLEGILDGQTPISYTPSIDPGMTGSYWSGIGIESISADGDSITIDANTESTLQLNYTTVDNAGCAATENMQVSVTSSFFNIMLDDTLFYDISTFPQMPYLNAYLSDWTLDAGAQWEWWPADGLQFPNSSFTFVTVPNDNDYYVLNVQHPSYPGCTNNDTIHIDFPDIQIGGYVFLDSNQNGIFDIDEQTLSNFPFTIAENQYSSFSDQTGAYFAFSSNSASSISFSVDYNLWTPTTPTTYNPDITDGQSVYTYNFGVIPSNTPITVVNGFVSLPSTLCIIENTQIISISNQGNTQPSGYVVYTFDPLCTFTGASPEPDSISGNQLFFNYGPLGYGDVAHVNVTLDMPDTALPGDSVWSHLQTFYFSGNDILQANTDPVTSSILCSYDPNDIRELNGVGPQGLVSPNTTLDYVIRFENLGTAPAYDVVIIDQLPVEVEWNSIVPVSSSHNYHMYVDLNGLLTIEFDDINLPSPNEDSLLNDGYIHFRINQIPDLPSGTQFTNSASIYFDYNEPIHTNDAITTIFLCPSTTLSVVLNENTLEILDNVASIEWYFNGSPLAATSSTLTAEQSGVYQAIATTALGCVLTSEEFDVNLVNQVATIYSKPRLFPNPSAGNTNLRVSSEWLGADLKIVSATGALIYTSGIAQEQVILPTEQWACGLYNISISKGARETSIRFIKQ